MRRSRMLTGVLIASVLITGAAQAGSVGLTYENHGIVFGNAPVVHGLRINAVDRDVETVDGLNLTFWIPRGKDPNPYFRMNGLAVGVVAPVVYQLQGVGIGGLGLKADRMTGLAIAGLGAGVDEMTGIGIGSLGMGGDKFTGLFVGGLGLGADEITGIGLGGLGIGGDRLSGLFVGGLGIGADELTGLFVGGLGVGGDRLTGLYVGGLGIGGDNLTGFFVGGLGIGADRISGASLGGLLIRADELQGVHIAPWVHAREESRGLSMAVFNYSRRLHGVQLGVLNWAGNQKGLLKLLPLVNYHR